MKQFCCFLIFSSYCSPFIEIIFIILQHCSDCFSLGVDCCFNYSDLSHIISACVCILPVLLCGVSLTKSDEESDVTCLEYVLKEGIQEASPSDAEPSQLTPVNIKEQWFTLISLQMFDLLTLSVRASPATLRRKLILAACICDLNLLIMSQW